MQPPPPSPPSPLPPPPPLPRCSRETCFLGIVNRQYGTGSMVNSAAVSLIFFSSVVYAVFVWAMWWLMLTVRVVNHMKYLPLNNRNTQTKNNNRRLARPNIFVFLGFFVVFVEFHVILCTALNRMNYIGTTKHIHTYTPFTFGIIHSHLTSCLIPHCCGTYTIAIVKNFFNK